MSSQLDILDRIEELERIDRTKLLERIERVERLFEEHKAMFYSYMKRHSEMEELEDRTFILERLQNEQKGYVSSPSSLRNFYFPDNNNLLTDFDGLILMKSEREVSNNLAPLYNGNTRAFNRKTMRNHLRGGRAGQLQEQLPENTQQRQPRAIIIESKNKLDKSLIDNKLKQFFKIYVILRDVKAGIINMVTTSEHFKQMYTNYELAKFPEDLYFVFASNSIDKQNIEYLLHIAKNTLTRELYDIYTIHYLRTLPAYDEFCRPKYITKQYIKDMNNTTSLDKVLKILDQYATNRYSMKLRAEIMPYEEMEPIFDYMKGRIGIRMFDKLHIESILEGAEAFRGA